MLKTYLKLKFHWVSYIFICHIWASLKPSQRPLVQSWLSAALPFLTLGLFFPHCILWVALLWAPGPTWALLICCGTCPSVTAGCSAAAEKSFHYISLLCFLWEHLSGTTLVSWHCRQSLKVEIGRTSSQRKWTKRGKCWNSKSLWPKFKAQTAINTLHFAVFLVWSFPPSLFLFCSGTYWGHSLSPTAPGRQRWIKLPSRISWPSKDVKTYLYSYNMG